MRQGGEHRTCHLNLSERVVHYPYETKDFCLCFQQKKDQKKLKLVTGTDSDRAEEKTTPQFTNGYVMKLNESVILYKAKKQPFVSQSLMEAEYNALFFCLENVL